MNSAHDQCGICAWRDPVESLRDMLVLASTKVQGLEGALKPSAYPVSYSDLPGTTVFAHDFCWQRLMKKFDQPPRLDTLVEVLLKTPKPKYREDCKRPPEMHSAIKTINLKDIWPFLRSRKYRKNTPRPEHVKVNFNTSHADPFVLIPMERRFAIAAYLSTAEFFHLRLSSKAMAPLFDSEQFWRTRFLLHGERGYLHFLTEDKYEEWRLLYRCTRSSFVWPLKLHDWRKQWLTHENIRDNYMMTMEEASTAPKKRKLQSAEPDNASQLEAGRASRLFCNSSLYLHMLRYGDSLISCPVPGITEIPDTTICCLCGGPAFDSKSQTIMIPSPIWEIRVSILVEDEFTHITGFDLIHGFDVPRTAFGYRVPGKQITVHLRSRQLQGFEMEMSMYGVQALRPITDANDLTPHDWIGQQIGPRRSFKTRVASSDHILSISGEFKDRKLMGLVVGSTAKSVATD